MDVLHDTGTEERCKIWREPDNQQDRKDKSEGTMRQEFRKNVNAVPER